jgi:peptidoglycan/xylan/chitin deacetylase (PgdA/CDA1 family)
MKIKYDPPEIIKAVFNNFYWNTSNDKVLITFDDGPNPESTPGILKILKANSIRSIFFCVGQNLEKYSELGLQIVNDGHIIGNHTHRHKNIRKLSEAVMLEEIQAFNDVYQNIFNGLPNYFRPPYGRFPLNMTRVLQSKGLKNVMWSLLTYDYKNDLNIVKFAVKNYLKKNSIVVLHDNVENNLIIENSLKFVIDTAYANGFEFGDPKECLK